MVKNCLDKASLAFNEENEKFLEIEISVNNRNRGIKK